MENAKRNILHNISPDSPFITICDCRHILHAVILRSQNASDTEMTKAKLDFKNAGVGELFVQQLIPALLGMVASALYVVADGIFVGRGVGSDAIAAVNINNPVMTFVSGIGLMFGMGGGVLASMNLARGKKKSANINLMQTCIASFAVSCVLTLILCVFPRESGYLLGSDEYLIEGVAEYLFWYALCFPFMVLMTALPFFVRLSNPNIPMLALSAGALLNVLLDYIFIFPFGWGLFGAAIATGIGQTVGALIMIFYLFRRDIAVHFIKLKISAGNILRSFRNIGYMMYLGLSVFLSEITISIMGIAGNYAFMYRLGADGVAAFSIVCYLFPVIFMVFNATIQSAQPIISYNYGCSQLVRSAQALRYALFFAIGFALVMAGIFLLHSDGVVDLFIPDSNNPAWRYAVDGLPYFSIDFVFFGINTIMIGYYTSVERLNRALLLTVVRGIMPVVYFFVLPLWLGDTGLWMSVAAADITTSLLAGIMFISDKFTMSWKNS